MNDKEKELWRVIDNVIKCCAIELPNGELSITREDVLGNHWEQDLRIQLEDSKRREQTGFIIQQLKTTTTTTGA